jgi:replicative DNA helicase
VALAQINRGVEGRGDKRPMMSDIKDCGAIEQDADLVITLYRDEYYDPQTSDRGITEIGIQKSRDGKTGTVKLLSDLQYSLFMNMPKGAQSAENYDDF